MALLALLAALAWLAVLLHPARPFDLEPEGDALPEGPAPDAWPAVAIVVPARNEAASLPATLASLLAQDYPGPLRVVVVDERSQDDTAAAALLVGSRGTREQAARLEIVHGAGLPPGWAGKPWGLQQGLMRCGALDAAGPRYVLFTDADIRHAPSVLRRLVAQSMADGLALNSRMARLSCATGAERLLIPPFAFFFAMLYPMRWVNAGRVAAAAGGCMLLDTAALRALDGVACIRDPIIDDVSLAVAVRGQGGRLFLARSAADVTSLRVYDFAAAWRMVRRSAFVQLRHSWALLAGCLLTLVLMFAVPPLALMAGARVRGAADVVTATLGAAGWVASATVFLPSVRTFRLPPWRALTLPLAGLLYGAMTLDSALRHALRRSERWRG